jgi:hypothetical protein
MPWADNWDERVAGTACTRCDEGRPAELKAGTRIYASEVADAYLMRRARVPNALGRIDPLPGVQRPCEQRR